MIRWKQRIISLLLCVSLIISMLPYSLAYSAEMEDAEVPYLAYENGSFVEKYVTSYNLITSSGTLTSGWYLVTGFIVIDNLNIDGDVKLILGDSASLQVNNGLGSSAGISLDSGSTLSIFAQSTGLNMGVLIANGADGYPGIGAGGSGSSGTINIYGGRITATGGYDSPGIGSSATIGSSFGQINIYDGFVTATNGATESGEPDIGGGDTNINAGIHIYGGTIVSGRQSRPEINLGGYSGSSNPAIVIEGGSVQIENLRGNLQPNSNGDYVTLNTWRFHARVDSILIDGVPYGNGAYTDQDGKLYIHPTAPGSLKNVLVTLEDGNQYWGDVQPDNGADFDLIAYTWKLYPRTASFSNYLPQDITIYKQNFALTSISKGGSSLNAGSDYIITGNTITIKESYLQNLSTGTTTLTFRFSDDTTETLTVTVNSRPSLSTSSLTTNTNEFAKFYIDFGYGTGAATGASITVANSVIASVDDRYVASFGEVVVFGNYPGTTTITVIFNDSAKTQKTVTVTVPSNIFPIPIILPPPPAPPPSEGDTLLDQQTNHLITMSIPVTTTTRSTSAYADLSGPYLSNAIAGTKSYSSYSAVSIAVVLNLTVNPYIDTVHLSITKSALESLIKADTFSFIINGAPVSVDLDFHALASLYNQADDIIVFSFSRHPMPLVPVPPPIERPFCSFDIATDTGIAQSMASPDSGTGALRTRSINSFGSNTGSLGTGSINSFGNDTGALDTQSVNNFGSGTIIIGIPYQPAPNEDLGRIFGVYLDESDNLIRIPDSFYDSNTGKVIIPTNHLGVYGVWYEAPEVKFKDTKDHWTKESIDYVVGRGLLTGTTKTTFSPDIAITRKVLAMALGKLAEVDVKAYTKSTFKDVDADSSYLPYIEWAYDKGVIEDIGKHKFAPDRAVTREEMAVILTNYAKATGYKLPITRAADHFDDASTIDSSYKAAVKTMQQAGVMTGKANNSFQPKAYATRGDFCAMLHRYIKLTVDWKTTQNWAKNDDGQYMYYKDGMPLIGWQSINGLKYFFHTDKTLQTGWVKDGKIWRYYSDNKAAVGWMDIEGKRYFFTRNGLMVANQWFKIDGKWYYFNKDGSLT